MKNIIKYLKQLFCNHQYEIAITSGIAFPNRLMIANEDKVEIICYCHKCLKRFKTIEYSHYSYLEEIRHQQYSLTKNIKNATGDRFTNQTLLDQLKNIKINEKK